jgi:hypothetical protein
MDQGRRPIADGPESGPDPPESGSFASFWMRNQEQFAMWMQQTGRMFTDSVSSPASYFASKL